MRSTCEEKAGLRPEAASCGESCPRSAAREDALPFSVDAASLRLSFTRKVLWLVFSQFLLTTLLIGLSSVAPPLQDFILESKLIYLTVSALTIALYLLIVLHPSLYKKVPLNYFFLLVLCVCQAYTLSLPLSMFSADSVLASCVITNAALLSLCVSASLSAQEFELPRALLSALAAVGLVMPLVCWAGGAGLLRAGLAGVGAIVASVLLVFYLGNRLEEQGAVYRTDDYILVALEIYVDFLRIFVEIVKLLEQCKCDRS